MSVVNKIVARRTQLSQSGRLVGDWIVENAEKAAQLTSQELAAQVKVSQSSIVKFTQRIGFKGYSEFKLALNEEIGRKHAMQSTPLHSDILADDPIAVISQKLVKAKTDAMFQTTNALSYEACHQAVKWLSEARRVQVVGIGGSALTAKVIALSAPGRSRLRGIADVTFDTIANETEHRSSSIASRTAQNVITDLLFIILVQQRDESARQLISDISTDIKQILT
ncbi:TPA: MurR/RpiR family transcriptional regulator [Vibrio parahaemolyticus]